MTATAFEILSWLWILLGVASCIIVAIDIRRRKPQPMAVMNFVWPINALWAGPIGIRAYWATGRTGPLAPQPLPAQAKQGMDMAPRPFWQSIIAGTLHCGAGCSLADLIGPILFRAAPFVIASSLVFGEWTLDYVLALLIGVTFQYAAISPMLHQTGARIWWRALKVDFLSLTAWQVGMYGWMAWSFSSGSTPFRLHASSSGS